MSTRRAGRGRIRSFRVHLATAFLGPDPDLRALEARAARYWQYPPSALHADVVPTLHALLDAGYRLGVIANQPSQVRAAMERDGLVGFFEVWGVSDDLGLHKPDPALFHRTLELAGVTGERTVMVGDRLDYDMRPARRRGCTRCGSFGARRRTIRLPRSSRSPTSRSRNCSNCLACSTSSAELALPLELAGCLQRRLGARDVGHLVTAGELLGRPLREVADRTMPTTRSLSTTGRWRMFSDTI